jgi:putative sigma-54 modulation protein
MLALYFQLCGKQQSAKPFSTSAGASRKMKILVNDKQKLLGAAAIKKAESKATASFAKFGYNVKSIDITVQDVNGPRGGIDKECRVLVKLRKMNDFTITVKDESLSKAVSNAISRAGRSVARQLDRRAMRESGRLSKFSFGVYGEPQQ